MNLISIAIRFCIPKKYHHANTNDGGHQQADKDVVPPEMLGNIAKSPTTEHGTGISEKTSQPDSRCCCIARSKISGRNAYQRLRSIDKKSYKEEEEDASCNGQPSILPEPQAADKQQSQRHADRAYACSLTMKMPVADITTENHAAKAAELEATSYPSRLLWREA